MSIFSSASRPRFTGTERSWILYDWANSSYATIILAAVFPIYFAGIANDAGVNGDILWGYGTSAATLFVAVLAPILGALGDFKGMKKKLFSLFLLVGLVFTITMALTDNWRMMLAGYVTSYIGYAGSLLFYDSFITDVTGPERMDRVSAWGYAMGYIGGSTIPFLLSIVLIMFGESFGIDAVLAVKLSVILCVLWWAAFSLPMLLKVKQVHFIDRPAGLLITQAFKGLKRTALDIIRNKAMLVFMLSYFFYIDGVNTVIHMATVYGSSLGLGSTGMILALLITQLVAVPCSIIFSRLAEKFGSIRMLVYAIIIYFFICITGFYMGFSIEQQSPGTTDYDQALKVSTMLFWAMAFLVGTVQGGIQALSRSFFGKLVPPTRSNEFFGFFDIFGKFAAVVGPALYAIAANASGRSSYGILSLILLFAAALIVMAIGRRYLAEAEQQSLRGHEVEKDGTTGI